MIFSFKAQRAEREAISWLARLESGDCTERQEKDFFSWLSSSPINQAAYIKAEDAWDRGGVLNQVPEPSQGYERLSFMRDLIGPRGALAAICLMAISFFFYEGARVGADYSVKTAIGEMQSLQLRDGSVVEVNTNSALHIQLRGDYRRVFLTKGEAFFNVKPDADRPFIITTDSGSIRVLGTQFSVRKEESDAVVTVMEGRVALGREIALGEEFKVDLVVRADEQISLAESARGEAAVQIDAASVLSWRQNKLVFERASLDRVLEEISRYFPEPIHLENPALASTELTAVIKISDFRTTVDLLAYVLNFNVEYLDGDSGAILSQ